MRADASDGRWVLLALAMAAGACRFDHLAGEGPWTDGGAAGAGGQPVAAGASGPGGSTTLDASVRPSDEDVPSLDPQVVGWTIDLNPDQVATRLAAFLWNAAPDDSLRRFVAARAPKTNVDVGAIADAMLIEARAQEVIPRFYDWWMSLEGIESLAAKDPTVAPWFTREVAQAMRRQVHDFAAHVTWAPDGSLARLLSAVEVPVPDVLLRAFRGAAMGTGSLKTLDANAYAGIWTLPAPNALRATERHERPTARGIFISERLLCRAVPSKPPESPGGSGLPQPPPAPVPTVRAALVQATAGATCAVCHKLFDPLGFAFGQFDAAGAFRVNDEDGLPVDDSGVIDPFDLEGSVPPVAFEGAPGLMRLAAASSRVQRCFSAHWVAFAARRPVTGSFDAFEDTSSVYVQKRAHLGGQLNLRGVVRAVTETRAFLAP